MKKSVLTVILLLSLVGMYAVEPVVVTGTWNRGRDKDVSLFYIISGRMEPLASYNLQKDGKFGFAFEPQKEGFYVIGNNFSSSPQNKYVFYFKPGDRLNLAVNDSTYTLVGKNTPENEALAKWHDKVVLLEWKTVYFDSKFGRWHQGGMPSTYVDFFPLLEETVAMADKYTVKTGNEKFDKEFKNFRQYDLLFYAWRFILTPRAAHPAIEDFPDFYKNNRVSKYLTTTEFFKYPYGSNMIYSGMFIQTQKLDPVSDEKLTPDETQARAIERIENDTLKGEQVLLYAGTLKSYDQYEKFNARYNKYILTEDQKERMNVVLTKIAQNKPITQTIDFSGTDTNEKKVSLSDFKGKVVVVDVWATWCGPCKKEIPSLKAMEKDYHGKDVVFMSISVDEVKDKQKWKDFVKKEELTGVQLFGGNGIQSDVSKFYKITAIPRFMVFDKKGNVATAEAPRPSDPALAKLIDDLLKK